MILYGGAERLFATARFPDRGKPIDYHTYLKKRGVLYDIYLHGNLIITLFPDDTYIIRDGGYRSITTKRRINEFSPIELFQHRGKWFFTDRRTNETYEFRSGLLFTKEGWCIDYEGDPGELDDKLKQLIENFNWNGDEFDRDGWMFSRSDSWSAPEPERTIRPSEFRGIDFDADMWKSVSIRMNNAFQDAATSFLGFGKSGSRVWIGTHPAKQEKPAPKEVRYETQDIGWASTIDMPSPRNGFEHVFVGSGDSQEDAMFDAVDQASVLKLDIPYQLHEAEYATDTNEDGLKYFFVLYL